MVRHEAAEALGGIASDAPSSEEKGEDVLAILREWAVKADAPVVVRESCQVAIDMWEVSSSPFPMNLFSVSLSFLLVVDLKIFMRYEMRINAGWGERGPKTFLCEELDADG